MMGPSHRVAGVAAWLAFADLTRAAAVPVAAGVVLAAATSHGRLSPDMDNYPLLAKVIPGGHRGIAHWWPVPALFLLALFTSVPWWIPVSVTVAWGSHLVTDAVFGKASRNRPAGVPVLRSRGRWRYVGVGLKAGGATEKWVAVPLFLAGIGLATWQIVSRFHGWPSP